jgi:hypothetical protein
VSARGVALVLLGMGLAAVALAWLRPSAPTDPPRTQVDFASWREANGAGVDAYLAFLDARGVAEVLPPQQLLRLGRRWRNCGGEAWAVPPRERWAAMVPTLALLRELRTGALAGDWDAVSAYRPPTFNRCEGGSPGSRHLANAAIDLQARGRPDLRTLCATWRRMGPARRWGLGFYAPDRIHVDTAGFRTWGYSYRADSSLCRGRPTIANPDRLESARLPTPEPP